MFLQHGGKIMFSPLGILLNGFSFILGRVVVPPLSLIPIERESSYENLELPTPYRREILYWSQQLNLLD